MDSHDISDTPQYAQSLRDMQLKLHHAQARKGQRPARPARSQVIGEFQMKLMISRALAVAPRGPGASFIRSASVPPPYPPCAVPFSELKKTTIDDLLLETHHRGSYLLVRSVTPQDRMTAVMAIVEDEMGDVVMLQLYHQEDDAEDILVDGTVMILKEPFLKLMSDGNYGLRVDHLSDVVFLSADDERIPSSWRREPAEQSDTALVWKTRGNNHFNKSAYRSAIECYTRALTCSPTPEETRTVRLNRSLAFLKTQRLDAALSDAESALTNPTATGKPAEKALFRKAEALYSLQRYRKCCEVLKELRLEYPYNTAAKSQLTRAVTRLAEQTNGKYPFKQLHAEAAKLRPPHLDRATYMGPVRVQTAGSRGRGLFTTKAVKAGDLLFCEKAFAHPFIDKEEGRGFDMTMLMDPENGGTMGAQSDLINMTVQKLYQNPSLLPVISGLHHGSYQPVDATEVDGKPVVDTFLIRRIVALNSFGCPLSTLTSPQRRTSQSPSEDVEKDGAFHSCGLWPTASLINHACTSTARRSFIGDLMLAHATRDLPANTEITWRYQAPTGDNHLQRTEKLRQNWGFVCDCAMCEDERGAAGEGLAERMELVEGLEGCLGGKSGRGPGQGERVVSRVETAVGAMADTYSRPASEVPRLAVWEVIQKAMGRLFGMRGEVQPVWTVKLVLGALDALGFVIDGGMGGTIVVRQWGLLMDGVVECWMFLRDAYRVVAPELVAPAEGYARTAYRMVFGEDETFEAYGEA